MNTLRLKVITPRKIVIDKDVSSVTIPTAEGEVTILPNHSHLFSLLVEGIIKIKERPNEEDYLAIGGGYLETDGKELSILVSRAYGQGEIDEKLIAKATEDAKKILASPAGDKEKAEALSMMRRATIDTKLLKKRKTRVV